MKPIFSIAVAAAASVVVAMGAQAAGDLPTKFSNTGGVANTRHNMTQRAASGGPSGAVMDAYRSDYGEVCVYCHTPHAANGAVKLPLWNRTLKATSYTTYTSVSVTQPIAQPGIGSLACLSCHDGQVAIDSIINMPGSGRYKASQATGTDPDFLATWSNPSGSGPYVHATLTECMACHSSDAGVVLGAGATDFKAFLIGTDLRDDHPVGVRYPAMGPGVDFRNLTASVGGLKFFDTNGNSRPDKEEVRVIDSGNGYQVECSSCHDPHGVPSAGPTSKINPSFLRMPSAGSAICLSCHTK